MEWIGYIGIGILVLLVLLVLVTNIQIVQQSRAYVVERLGAYSATWGVGLHFKIPFFERVVKKVSLKEQVADFDPQPVITKDNVTMQIDTVIYFQITDPKLYTYGVEHPMNAIENLTATTLRNIIGEMELDQSLTSRDVINTKMRAILDECARRFLGRGVPREELIDYAENVMTRFANPYIRHEWASISLNSVSKFKVRVLPSLLEYERRFGKLPHNLTFSLARLIELYRTREVNDDPRAVERMKHGTVHEILSDEFLWGEDISHLEGAVSAFLKEGQA